MIAKASHSAYNRLEIDDASVASSTMLSMDDMSDKKELLVVDTNSSKCVRFAEADNQYYSNTVVFKEECKPLWNSRQEYQQFRKAHSQSLWNLMERDDEEGDEGACSSYATILEDIHTACCAVKVDDDTSIDELARQRLQACTAKDRDERVGLEYASVAALSESRQERRRRLYKRVARLQAMSPATNHPALPSLLREMCESTSRPGRLLARQFAQTTNDNNINDY